MEAIASIPVKLVVGLKINGQVVKDFVLRAATIDDEIQSIDLSQRTEKSGMPLPLNYALSLSTLSWLRLTPHVDIETFRTMKAIDHKRIVAADARLEEQLMAGFQEEEETSDASTRPS